MKVARIHGGGIAALAAARALSRLGWRLALGDDPPPSHRVVLSARTVATLDSLFGDPALWHGTHRLRRRYVRWDGQRTALLPGDAYVVHSGRLAARMRASVARDARATRGTANGTLTIAARGTNGLQRVRWGERVMLVAETRLAAGADPDASWTEATPSGWIFVAPATARTALVQAMVPTPPRDPAAALQALIAGARTIAPILDGAPREVRAVSGAPGLARELCGPGLIVAGEEALSVDPVSGEGSGYAAREAILAAAVADAVETGLDAEVAFDHYRARLEHALAAHLRTCLQVYTAPFDASWSAERAACAAGSAALETAAAERRPFTLGLRGLRLAPLA